MCSSIAIPIENSMGEANKNNSEVILYIHCVCVCSWYRSGTDQKLHSVLKPGGGRDFPTTSVLTINPEKEDDGVQYRCVVWNRALTDNEKMEATVSLSVNCKFTIL